MKKFLNAESTVEKPKYWEDKYHSFALLRQEEIVIQPAEEKNGIPEVKGYRADYIMYDKEEWQELITQGLKEDKLNQLDQSIETVRANKITETKVKLEQYYREHPLFSKVHKETGEYYSVTSDKQSYLTMMITLCDQAEQLGVEFQPTWNATGEACEPWTVAELKQLALQIAAAVYPAVSKQQKLEKTIKELSTVEEIQALEISYETTE